MAAKKQASKKRKKVTSTGAATGAVIPEGATMFTAREQSLINHIIEKLRKDLTAYFDTKWVQAGLENALQHNLDHTTWRKILPWAESEALAAEQREKFWRKVSEIADHVLERVIKDSFTAVLKWGLIGLAALFIFGFSGAGKYLGALIKLFLGLDH